MLLGGFIGFAAGFLISLLAGSDATFALRDAAICCVAGALMLRVASQFINSSIAELAIEKAKEHEAQAHNAHPEST